MGGDARHPRRLCRFRAARSRSSSRAAPTARWRAYPPVENHHATTSSTPRSRRRGIAARDRGRGRARSPATSPSGSTSSGVLAVEMFVTRDGRDRWSTSWRRGRTIPATGRSTPASPASSSSWCGRSAACRSARPSATRDAVHEQPDRRATSTNWRDALDDPRRQAAPLRQDRGPARPQDGPRHPAFSARARSVRRAPR